MVGLTTYIGMTYEGEIEELFLTLPECFYEWNGLTEAFMRHIIISGNDTYPDPLVRIASMGTLSQLALTKTRLINPTTSFVSDQIPYLPDWPTLIPLLSHVSFLSMAYTNLEGPLPDTAPVAAQYLYFPHNALSGTIPSTFRAGPLQYVGLDLSFNNLTGPIPATFVSTACSDVFVDLSNNKLTSLPDSFDIDCYSWTIHANNNTLAGDLSPTLLDGVRLTSTSIELDLSDNRLTGSIPSTFIDALIGATSEMTRISLYFGRNQLSGPIPHFWPSFKSGAALRKVFFDFSSNLIEGSLEASPLVPRNSTPAYNKINTVNWNLAYNNIAGTLPGDLCGPTPVLNLFAANLSFNAISGPLPLITGELEEFFLAVATNRLTGSIPSNWLSIQGPPDQMTIDLSNNELEGTVPNALLDFFLYPTSGSPEYLLFDLSNNAFTGPLPNIVRGRSAVAMVDLSNNQFSGALNSSSLFTVTSTDGEPSFKFDASNNAITGALNIPDVANTTFAATYINLASNQLTQLVVSENANYMFALDVSGNTGLTGTIPSHWFSNDSYLLALAASHTSLSGSFPREVGEEADLEALDLSHTKIDFCGGSRVAWTSAPQLTSCNLDSTDAYNCSSDYPSVCSTAAPVPVAPPTAPSSSPSAPFSPSAPSSTPTFSPRAPSKAPTSDVTTVSRTVSVTFVASFVVALALLM